MADKKPLRADAMRNRQAIITAARIIFDSDEEVRFDDFAARAGVGVGTLYRHFETREMLAAAVYQDEVAALIEQSNNSTRPPGVVLAEFLRSFVEYVLAHPALARALSTLVESSAQAEGGYILERAIADLMDRAVAEGAVRPHIPPGSVMVVLHGISASARRADWAAEARAATELLIVALRSPTTPEN